MNPQQRQRAKEDREYAKLRKAFLFEGAECEISSPDCIGAATEISHIAGNGRTGGRGRRDTSNWERSCHPCGQYVEHNKEWALETGHHIHAWEYRAD